MQLTFEGKTIDQLAIELIQAVVDKSTAYVALSFGKDGKEYQSGEEYFNWWIQRR